LIYWASRTPHFTGGKTVFPKVFDFGVAILVAFYPEMASKVWFLVADLPAGKSDKSINI
jgi:hypothetical protein